MNVFDLTTHSLHAIDLSQADKESGTGYTLQHLNLKADAHKLAEVAHSASKEYRKLRDSENIIRVN